MNWIVWWVDICPQDDLQSTVGQIKFDPEQKPKVFWLYDT